MTPDSKTPQVLKQENRCLHSQLHERQVREAIVGPVLALELDIVLEGRDRLGVVTIEAAEDSIDMLGAGVLGDRNGGHFGGRGSDSVVINLALICSGADEVVAWLY